MVTQFTADDTPLSIGTLLWFSSSLPGTSALAALCPRGLSVRLISSASIESRVVRARSSTSAEVRDLVGMGGRTVVAF